MAVASILRPYQIGFGNANVKVDVIDHHMYHSPIALEKLSQLKKQLTKRRVVGLGFECDQMFGYYGWLLLCAGDHCLMINLLGANFYKYDIRNKPPDLLLESLNNFLSDPTINFVFSDRHARTHHRGLECKSGLSVGYLLARARKNPSLLYGSLEKLGVEVGLDIKPRSTSVIKTFDWSAQVFSEEGIEFAFYNVYNSYLIADKLMADLSA